MKIENIKFKAKSIYNNEWVYGDLLQQMNGTYILTGKGENQFDFCPRVDPSTVCQFTGLIDMNGVEVYENDIVKAVDWEETICNVEYKDYGFCLCSKSFRDGVMPLFVAVGNCDIYVVGNKFNKEK